MAYDNLKLEKGLYTTGKSFTQALEQIDPSENYAGTPLEGLAGVWVHEVSHLLRDHHGRGERYAREHDGPGPGDRGATAAGRAGLRPGVVGGGRRAAFRRRNDRRRSSYSA